MRVVADTSALMAILLSENEAEACLDVLERADEAFVSANSAYELQVVMLRRQGREGADDAARLPAPPGLHIVPFDAPLAEAAAAAYSRFGKGIDPNARLNLADCAAYATARALDAALLFKGEDFRHTDALSAHPQAAPP